MQITLKPEYETFIQAQLDNGHYQSADDLFAQALELLKQQITYEEWLTETRQKITVGVEALARGEGVEGDVVIAQLRDRLYNPQQ
ncbi:type II toxin-antitoxin system ParD family antitoxin [Spirulina major CS-329]|jgi:antitoxin ParD1/3/4|uniref:ribbon-helix-helix domain-containing protein n=1 Tax=Spirulina TaxID=1154 RepID=UPI00232B4DF1|nr:MULTISPECIES: type II toxin-antitoxin system ParD family antitoxin [Spirulina]MDB9493088.1 type II toxin-antitoxin system ParD family antitoxin [Spirulina subsalsa CS-330]MDB9504955.1 type II toxin-antitoxin system ParD family antitoxin [Spirulina major CS-329]